MGPFDWAPQRRAIGSRSRASANGILRALDTGSRADRASLQRCQRSRISFYLAFIPSTRSQLMLEVIRLQISTEVAASQTESDCTQASRRMEGWPCIQERIRGGVSTKYKGMIWVNYKGLRIRPDVSVTSESGVTDLGPQRVSTTYPS